VRQSLEADGFEVVAEVGSGSEAVRAAARTHPDVCLLDVFMPEGGIEAAAEIHRLMPAVPIVMLTVSASEEDMFAALHAGASGYLPKTTPADRLSRALRGILAGEGGLSRRLTAKLIDEFRRRGTGRHHAASPAAVRFADRLTEREIEVLDLLAEGQATSQIATRLAISDVTVRRHVSAIVRKTGAGDRADVLRLVSEERNRSASAP
jgi:DNA-binding NarL/FixJ family response regulator